MIYNQQIRISQHARSKSHDLWDWAVFNSDGTLFAEGTGWDRHKEAVEGVLAAWKRLEAAKGKQPLTVSAEPSWIAKKI